jgi:hypothetical protein
MPGTNVRLLEPLAKIFAVVRSPDKLPQATISLIGFHHFTLTEKLLQFLLEYSNIGLGTPMWAVNPDNVS